MSPNDILEILIESDFSSVAAEFFPKLSPEDINGGDCFNWAWVVYHKAPGAQLVQSVRYDHAFVQIGNSYFDAEHPTGSDIVNILPELRKVKRGSDRFNDSFETVSPTKFRKRWKVSSRILNGVK